MKRILILTHGNFAEGICDSLRMIAGAQDVTTICMQEDDSPKEIEDKLVNYINQTSPEDKVIVITDIPGGSTTKSAIPLLKSHKNVHVVTGLNLALLLEIVFIGEDNIAENISNAIEASRSSVMYLNDMIGTNE